MDAVFLKDLVDGKNDWLNIQSVLRHTFKLFNDIIVQQKSEIETLYQKIDRLQHQVQGHGREINSLVELKNDVEELRQIVSSKADRTEVNAALETKAGIVDVYNSLKVKANTNDVLALLEQKVDIQHLNQCLETKANKASVASALRKKANKSDVDAELKSKADAEQVAQILQTLENKAEKSDVQRLSTVSAAMVGGTSRLASQSDVAELRASLMDANARITSMNVSMTNLQKQFAQTIKTHAEENEILATRLEAKLQDKVDSDSITKVHLQIEEIHRELEQNKKALETLKTTKGTAIDNLQKQMEDLRLANDCAQETRQEEINALRGYIISKTEDVKKLANGKVSVREVKELVDEKINQHMNKLLSQTLNEALQEKVGKAEFNKALDGFQQSVLRTIQEGELAGAVDRLRIKMDECTTRISHIDAQLERVPTSERIAKMLEKKADLQPLNTWIAEHTKKTNEILDHKAALEDVLQLRQDVQQRITMGELREELKKFQGELAEKNQSINRVLEKIALTYVDKEELNSHLQPLHDELQQCRADINEKMDRNECMKELSQKVSIATRKSEDAILLEKLSQKINASDLHAWAEDVQNELKRLLNTKTDNKDFSAAISRVNTEKASKVEMEVFVEKKLQAFRESMENLGHGLRQIISDRGSTTTTTSASLNPNSVGAPPLNNLTLSR